MFEACPFVFALVDAFFQCFSLRDVSSFEFFVIFHFS